MAKKKPRKPTKKELELMSVGENRYIYSLHDPGGEHLMDGQGWVVITQDIGHNPNDQSGANFLGISRQGLGVITRLNNGYGSEGTIPNVEYYQDFAVRCGNFAQSTKGCNIWIIGNEPNHQQEWPDGNPIFPGDYARCYKLCREEIHKRPGHEGDMVLLAAPGPWNASIKYATNPTGDWVQYLQDQIWGVQDFSLVDGVSLHTYTHGHDPELIRSIEKMQPPFENRYFQFWAYKDFLNGLRAMGFLDKPLYITETNGDDPNWSGGNNGWVREAYKDINSWNEQNPRQVIRCLTLFRWQKNPLGYAIESKPEVQEDFVEAIEYGYTWTDEVVIPPKPEQEALAYAIETAARLEAATKSNNKTIDALEDDDGARALRQAIETATHLEAATESNQNTIDVLSGDTGEAEAMKSAVETARRIDAATESNQNTIKTLEGARSRKNRLQES